MQCSSNPLLSVNHGAATCPLAEYSIDLSLPPQNADVKQNARDYRFYFLAFILTTNSAPLAQSPLRSRFARGGTVLYRGFYPADDNEHDYHYTTDSYPNGYTPARKRYYTAAEICGYPYHYGTR